jgi:hypothetical protein
VHIRPLPHERLRIDAERLPTLVPQVQAVADDPSRYLAGAFPS